MSVKQYKAFLVDCLFDHNCEKVSVAVYVGKCVEGLKKWVYLCAHVRLKAGEISINGRRRASRQRSGA